MRFLKRIRWFHIVQVILVLLTGCLPENCQVKLQKFSRYRPVMTQVPQTRSPRVKEVRLLKPDPWPECTKLYSKQLMGADRVVFVDANSAVHGEGASWDKPSKSIAYALKSVFNARNLGDDRPVYIIIAGGAYSFSHENSFIRLGGSGSIINFSGLNPDYYKNIHILGGYRPLDVCLELAENIKAFGREGREVILDGEMKSNHVVNVAGQAQDIVFKDLTIKRGHARAAGDRDGGGFLIDDLSKNITLERIKISESRAQAGGGIAIKGLAYQIKLIDTIVDSCMAENRGGGIDIASHGVDITRGLITNNRAKNGGGVYFLVAQAVNLVDTKIEHNQINHDPATPTEIIGGGGIYMFHSTRITIMGGSISFNRSDGQSVGNGGGISRGNDIKIIGTVFDGNKSANLNDTDGLALNIRDSKEITLENTTIRNNINGHFGGGIYADKVTVLALKNVTMENNSASLGGGAYFDNSEVKISGLAGRVSRFTNNNSHHGGAIYYRDIVDTEISFTVFDRNWTDSGGGTIYVLNLGGMMQILSTTISNGTAETNAGGIYIDGGAGNKPYQQLSLIDSRIEGCRVNNAYPTAYGSAGIYATNLNSIVLNNVKFIGNQALFANNANHWAAALMFHKRAEALPQKNPAFKHDVATPTDPFIGSNKDALQPFQILGNQGVSIADNELRLVPGQAPSATITSGISIPKELHPNENLVVAPMQSAFHYFLWLRFGATNSPITAFGNTPPISGANTDLIKTH